MNIHPSHAAKVGLVIFALAISSLIFGISAADYYSYPQSSVAVRKINSLNNYDTMNDYKSKARNLFENLSSIALNTNQEAISLENLKDEFIALAVPKEFMNLHVGLVMATDKLIEYKKSKDNKKLQQATIIISQAKKQYDWLN